MGSEMCIRDSLRAMEKKMWSIFGGLAIISFVVSPVGQKIIKPLTNQGQPVTLESIPNQVAWTSLTTNTYGLSEVA